MLCHVLHIGLTFIRPLHKSLSVFLQRMDLSEIKKLSSDICRRSPQQKMFKNCGAANLFCAAAPPNCTAARSIEWLQFVQQSPHIYHIVQVHNPDQLLVSRGNRKLPGMREELGNLQMSDSSWSHRAAVHCQPPPALSLLLLSGRATQTF